MALCRECSSFLEGRRMMCPRCGTWTPHDGGSLTSPEVKEEDFVDVMDVQAQDIERIVTGGPWDEAWGGGFVPSTCTLLGGAPGAGKMLCLQTPLATPSGWTTMGAIRRGDTLFDECGNPCRVLQVHAIVHSRRSYAVTFSDGETLIADAEHLWRTSTKRERTAAYRRTDEARARRRAKRSAQGWYDSSLAVWREPKISVTGSVRTTREIADSLHVGAHVNHSIERTAPLKCPRVILPVPPYTLGVWLGDGSTGVGAYTGLDPEVAEHVRAEGYAVRERNYGQRASTWSVYGLAAHLRTAGVLYEKHIPAEYLRASIAQRLELLRGLMDTDGECGRNGQCGFSTTNVGIRDGFYELLTSLGIKANFVERRTRCAGKDYGPHWRFTFSAAMVVFYITRKARRQITPKRGVDGRRYITRIQRVRSVPMRCISVDSPSKLYLAGRGMVPTHNTTLLLQLAVIFAQITRKRSYFISAEQHKGAIKLTLDRLGLPVEHGMIRVLNAQGAGGSIDERVLDKDPPGMIILDSVSALCGNDKHAQITVCKQYIKYAVKYKSKVFLIAHMTKEHDYAGLMALQHEVDALVTLFPDEDGSRTLRAWKNRYGATHGDFKLLMTERGFIAAPPPPEKKKKKGVIIGPEIMMPGGTSTPLALEEIASLPRQKWRKPEAPDEIVAPSGERLVNRKKAREGKIKSKEILDEIMGARAGRAAAVEGEARKSRREPKPTAVERAKEHADRAALSEKRAKVKPAAKQKPERARKTKVKEARA